MSAIDRDVPIPLYYQIKQLIKERISNGALKPGDKLPAEDELCEVFAVSRTPVRQALTELVHEGLLIRIHGRGTFIAEPAPESEASGETTLSVVVSDARWREPLEEAASLWNVAHQDDPIRLNFDLVPLKDLRSTLIAAVGRGEAPDISVLDSVWVAEFANQQYLRPLDEVDHVLLKDNMDSFFPVTLAANRYQGHLYAMPTSTNVGVLWYRRDWLDREGLAPPSTWDELVAVGQHFRQTIVRSRYGIGEHPLAFVGGRRGGETTTHQLLPFLWAAGGDLVADGQVVLDSPQSRRAVAFLKSLIYEHKLVSPEVVGYAWDQASQFFAEGKIALALGGSYESFFIQQIAGWVEEAFHEHVAFAPVPAGPNGRQVVIAGGMSYGLYRQSRLPTQALALLEMMGQPEVLGPFCIKTGHIPPRVSVAQMLSHDQDSFLARTVPLLEIAKPRPVIPEYARVSEQFQTMIEDCLSGRRQVDEVVLLTTERISAITGLPSAGNQF